MVIRSPTQPASKLLEKKALQKAVAELDERVGFIQDPSATAEKAQALMLARGIRPEERFLSSEIIRMRHEHEEE